MVTYIMPGHSDSLPTSHTLLQKILAGDNYSWNKLVDVYTGWIVHCCKLHGFKEADAFDITQNVFLSLFRQCKKFKIAETPGSFRKWLSVCAFNEACKIWEYQKYQGAAKGGSGMDFFFTNIPDKKIQADSTHNFLHDNQDLLQRVLHILKTEFSDVHFMAFKRHIMDGQKAVDVANELKLGKSNVRTICSRIMTRLREMIDDE